MRQMARSKSELRQEIQKRINAIAKSQYSTSIISKIVIVGACRSPDFDSQDCSLGSNLENQIIERSIFFAERFFNDYNLNFHGSDLGEVHSTIIRIKESKSVFIIVGNRNPDFCIVFYNLSPKNFENFVLANDAPKIVSLYKEMLEV